MINEVLRRSIEEFSSDGMKTVILENPSFDNSIEGITDSGQLVYNYDKMIKELMEDEKMSSEEASDFVSSDTLRAIPYFGDYKPIIIYSLDKGE